MPPGIEPAAGGPRGADGATGAVSAVGDPRLARVVALFEQLTPAALAGLGEVYAGDARFIDPFNDVTGLAPITRVFGHMFEALDAPRFTVLTRFSAGDEAFLTWDFSFRRHGSAATLRIHGGTHLRFAPDGRVQLHRDYWDAAQQVYERVPLLGAVLRWLRGRLAAD